MEIAALSTYQKSVRFMKGLTNVTFGISLNLLTS